VSAAAKLLSAAFLAVGLSGPFVPAGCCQAEVPGTDKSPLRIFYAGKPGSAREADFVAFLRQHFRHVSTGDLASFEAQQAADADVILLDHDGNGFKAPRPKLPTDYTRPTVTIGVAGAVFCDYLRLKTGYM